MMEKDSVIHMAELSLKKDEGFSQHLYKINDIWHIGYGFNLESMGILPEEAQFILNNRIKIAVAELLRNIPYYPTLSDNRRSILINLCYNMGIVSLMSFRKLFDAIEHKDWVKASYELMNSEAAKQNPARMERLAYCFEVDKMS